MQVEPASLGCLDPLKRAAQEQPVAFAELVAYAGWIAEQARACVRERAVDTEAVAELFEPNSFEWPPLPSCPYRQWSAPDGYAFSWTALRKLPCEPASLQLIATARMTALRELKLVATQMFEPVIVELLATVRMTALRTSEPGILQ